MTLTKSGGITFENAVREAAEGLKGASTITPKNGVTSTPSRRHDDVATAVILKKLEDIEKENRSLKEEIRKRDSLFVEALEEMKASIGANRGTSAAASCTNTRKTRDRCVRTVLTGARKRT